MMDGGKEFQSRVQEAQAPLAERRTPDEPAEGAPAERRSPDEPAEGPLTVQGEAEQVPQDDVQDVVAAESLQQLASPPQQTASLLSREHT